MRHLTIMLIATGLMAGCGDNISFGEGGAGPGGGDGAGGNEGDAGGAPGGQAPGGGEPVGGGGAAEGGAGAGGGSSCVAGATTCSGDTLLTCDGAIYTDPVDCVDVGMELCVAGACEFGLELRLGFDEGSGNVTFDDAQGIQGQLINAGWTAGQQGSAVLFDGTGQVSLGDTLNTVSLPFTLAAWVYIPAGVTSNATVIATDGAMPYQGAYLRVDVEQGSTVVVGYGNASGTGPAQRHAKRSALGVPFDEWVHITGVFRLPDDASIYVDGMEAGGTYSGSAQFVAHTGDPATVGRDVGGIAGLTGSVDDVRAYSRALTPPDVLLLAGSGPM